MTSIYRHRGLARVIAPAAEVISVAEARDFLRISHGDDDARLSDMIITARTLAEQWLRRSLVTQSWKASFADEISGTIYLPMGPVQSISSVASITIDNVSTTQPTSSYALSVAKDAIVIDSLISGYRIEVTYVAGYGASGQIPKPIKLGMLQHISAMYDGELTLAPIPDDVLSMYMNFREIAL